MGGICKKNFSEGAPIICQHLLAQGFDFPADAGAIHQLVSNGFSAHTLSFVNEGGGESCHFAVSMSSFADRICFILMKEYRKAMRKFQRRCD